MKKLAILTALITTTMTTAQAANNNSTGFEYNTEAFASGGSGVFVTGTGAAEFQTYSSAEQTSGFTEGTGQGTAFTFGTDSAGAMGYTDGNAIGEAGAWGTRYGEAWGWSN